MLADLPPDSLQARNLERIGQEMSNRSQFDSAAAMYSGASGIWAQHSRWQDFIQARLLVAYNILFKNDFSSAYDILTDAEKVLISHPEIDRSLLGRVYILQGYIHTTREDHAAAIERITRGVEIYAAAIGTENATYASALYTLGSAEYNVGRYETADELLRKAEALQQKYSGAVSIQVATTQTMIGLVLDAKNEFDEAIATFLDALEIFRALGKEESPQSAHCYLQLLSTYRNKGDYTQAILYGKKAIDTYQRIGLPDHINAASTYCTLGEVYTAVGDFDNAQLHLQRSLDLFREKHPDKKAVIGILHQLFAKLYDRTGDRKKALEYSLTGIDILERTYGTAHPQIGFMYEHVADIHSDAGRYADALTYYRKALAARQLIGSTQSRNDAAVLHSSIAHVYTQMGRLEDAGASLATASALLDESRQKNIVQRSLLHKRYGNLYRARKQYDKAEQSYRQAIAVLTGGPSPDESGTMPSFDGRPHKKELLDLLKLTGSLYEIRYASSRNLNDLKGAFDHYHASLDPVDELRRQYSTDGSKLMLATESAALYGNACRLAVMLFQKTGDAAYKERAFLIADRGKANVLLDKVFDGEAKHFAGIPDELLEKENNLLRQIASLDLQMQKSIETDAAPHSAANLSAQLFTLRADHAKLVEVFEHTYPEYFTLKYNRPVNTVREIQSSVDPGTVIVQYVAGAKDLYAFALSRDRLTVHILPNTEKINALIEEYTGALRRYDEPAYRSSGAALYASVVRPLERYLAGAKNVVIIPDGNLHYVPFDALPAGSASGRDLTAIDYLITKYTISYSYSAAFFMKMRNASGHEAVKSFAGFAPVFRDSTKNGDFLANRSFVEGSGITDHRSITVDGKKFNELPYSEQEIGSIARSFDVRTMPQRTFLHTDATETNFKRYGKGYDILHVATHGFINEENPKLSAILFSQPSSEHTEDDGILYVNETFNLDLNADLIVLSSCESGVGTLVQGEGMMALTRGLFYAGARNIIYSLWKVSDKQTYLLMDKFYAAMHSGKSYAEALRQAKLAMIASKESAFPAKWSGFVLMGE